jgi:hypothetical protein
MNILFKNKLLYSIIFAGIISYVFYIINKPESTEIKESSFKDDLISIIFKGAGIAVFIYLIMYFVEDNEEEVYNYIDTGEPDF